MKKLRLGIIGCGGFSNNHLDEWKKINQVEIVAICGHKNQKRLKDVSDKYKIQKGYFDFEEMFKKEKLDLIDIISPSESHKSVIFSAVNNGIKNILCEKPLSDNMEDAKEIVNVCENNNIRLTVFQNFRHHSWYLKMKELIEEKKINNIFYVSIYHRTALLNSFDLFGGTGIFQKNSRSILNLDKLIIIELALHFYDILRFLFGEPKSIFCKARKVIKDSKGENVSISMIEFDNLDALVEVSWCSIGEDLSQMVRIEGTDGTILLDDEGDDAKLNIFLPQNTKIKIRPGMNHPKTIPTLINIDTKNYLSKSIYKLEKIFVDSIIKKSIAMPTGRDNLKTMEMVFAAYKSSDENKVIKFNN